MDNDEKYTKEKEDNMNAILKDTSLDLKRKLDEISKKASVLKTRDGKIEIDSNNLQHKEWFEIDKYKGK